MTSMLRCITCAQLVQKVLRTKIGVGDYACSKYVTDPSIFQLHRFAVSQTFRMVHAEKGFRGQRFPV